MAKIKDIDDFSNKADMVKKTTTNKNLGRPKKSKDDLMSEKLHILLTKEQKEDLEKKANAMGVSLSAYAKMKIFQ